MATDNLQSTFGGQLTIDLSALVGNYRRLEAEASPAKVAAVVKADAYGLGAERVVTCLERAGCSDFFVAHLMEALALKPIVRASSNLYVLNGLQPGAEALCAAQNIIPVINGLEQAWRWRDNAIAGGAPRPAALQIDTGMRRLGLSAEDVATLVSAVGFFDHVPLALVMSHLACSDEPGRSSNFEQLQRFQALADRLPPAPRSLANSGGVFLGKEFHGDLVRPGLALYGAAPSVGLSPMNAVVRLGARVIQVRDVGADEAIGYGLTYARRTPGRLATIAVGYADGWPRSLSNKGAAYYEGVRLPIAGRVSMDSIILDISVLAAHGLSLTLGDEVELLGPHQSLDDVARAADTIPYEMLTRLGRRYFRTYVEDQSMRSDAVKTLLSDARP